MEQNEHLSPDTTKEQDVVSASQRRINLIWEHTQAAIALFVVISGILLNSAVVLWLLNTQKEVIPSRLALMSICLQFINITTGIIIGFYFSRTNHSATGGVGTKLVGTEKSASR